MIYIIILEFRFVYSALFINSYQSLYNVYLTIIKQFS